MSEIQRKSLEVQKQKAVERERSRQKELKEKEELTDHKVYYGLWQSKKDIIDRLDKIETNKEKKLAITTQLKFRKLVLKQTLSDMSLFNTSQTEAEELSLTDLKRNLTLLIVDSLFFNKQRRNAD